MVYFGVHPGNKEKTLRHIRSDEASTIKAAALDGDREGQRRMNVPVTGLPVQKKVSAVRLVLLQVKVPDAPIILDENYGSRITGRARSESEEVPHQPRLLSSSRFGELNLSQKMIPLRGRAVLKSQLETEKQIGRIWPFAGKKFQRIDRKLLVRLWLRLVLISERYKAVVSRDEKILPADVGSSVKRRFMAQSALAVLMPDLLNLVGNLPPGSQSTSVNIELRQLPVRPGKPSLRLLLIIAAPVHMIESQVPNGAPTISDKNRWNEARHSSSCRSNTYANIRKITERGKCFVSHF